MRDVLLGGVLAIFVGGCHASPPVDTATMARDLARRTLILDTHVDVPYRLQERWEDVTGPTEDGDFDLPRAREGGLDAAFFSIYVPASYQERGGAKEFADELIGQVEGIVASSPERIALARSVADVRRDFAAGRFSVLLGMENGAPIEDDLANVDHFRDRGIRYVTLTHSRDNQICDSSYDESRTWGGLSPFGHEVVREMNRAGIMVDVSHVSDDAFWQVLGVARAPVIASHSSCRAFTPGWERNLSDEMIQAIARNGGVVQINFGSTFLRDDVRQRSDATQRHLREYAEEHHLARDSQELQEYRDAYVRGHPAGYATLEDVVAHVEHVVDLVGVDHVGFGSDFDGVGDSLPVGLKDVSDYPNLVAALLARGFTREDVEKICSGNLLRVLGEVEAVARDLAGGT